MDSLVERWRNTIKSTQRKSQHTDSLEKTQDPPQSSIRNQQSSKKSEKKKKKKESQRIESPAKTSKSQYTQSHIKTQNKDMKSLIIQQFIERIQNIKGTDRISKLFLLLEQLWSQAQLNISTQNYQFQSNLKDSQNKVQKMIYSDLENKYFMVQRQKQNLKLQLQQVCKKCQSQDKQINRLLKIQRLVDNCIKREDLLNKQIEFLRNQLKIAQQKQLDQQRIFKKQVLTIHGLIEAIKQSLPT